MSLSLFAAALALQAAQAMRPSTIALPLLLLPPLALAACAPAERPGNASANGVVTARLGETVRLGGLRVRPIAVVEDSRCPRDVTCVWAGRLRLRVAISGLREQPVLTQSEAHGLPRGGTLTLVSAIPERWQNPPPGSERGPANRFGFRRD